MSLHRKKTKKSAVVFSTELLLLIFQAAALLSPSSKTVITAFSGGICSSRSIVAVSSRTRRNRIMTHRSSLSSPSGVLLSSSSTSSDGASSHQKNNNSTDLTLARTTNHASDEDDEGGILALQQQAAALRAEAEIMETNLRALQEAKRQKELADIDRWIEECLYVNVRTLQQDGRSSSKNNNKEDKNINNNDTPSESTTSSSLSTDKVARVELLNSVETAAQILRDGRFSHEHVSKMFERICATSPAQSRTNCSPLLALLVDAAGKLDCVEREDNPNKRWDGRVERDLRKRLFAMDWNIELEPYEDKNDRFI